MEQKQKCANPTPAGLIALAVACFCFFALLTGSVQKSAMPFIGTYLIGGFIVQLFVAIYDIKNGNAAGGNTFLFFAAYFMLVSGVSMFLKYFIPTLDTTIDGFAWLALMLALFIFTPSFYKSPSLLFIIIALLDIALPCIMLNDFKAVTGLASVVLSNIAGYAMLLAGIVGLYLSGAILTNATYGRNVLPNPPSFYKAKAEIEK